MLHRAIPGLVAIAMAHAAAGATSISVAPAAAVAVVGRTIVFDATVTGPADVRASLYRFDRTTGAATPLQGAERDWFRIAGPGVVRAAGTYPVRVGVLGPTVAASRDMYFELVVSAAPTAKGSGLVFAPGAAALIAVHGRATPVRYRLTLAAPHVVWGTGARVRFAVRNTGPGWIAPVVTLSWPGARATRALEPILPGHFAVGSLDLTNLPLGLEWVSARARYGGVTQNAADSWMLVAPPATIAFAAGGAVAFSAVASAVLGASYLISRSRSKRSRRRRRRRRMPASAPSFGGGR